MISSPNDVHINERLKGVKKKLLNSYNALAYLLSARKLFSQISAFAQYILND